MVNMLRSTFELDLQTFLNIMHSVSILCFHTSLVDVKDCWLMECIASDYAESCSRK